MKEAELKPQNIEEELIIQSQKNGRYKVFISKIKRKVLKHVYLVRFSILLVLAAVFVSSIYYSYSAYKRTNLSFYLHLAKDFAVTPGDKISSIDGRTNILLLGKGGKGHEAPDLTDTMIFMSVKNNPSGKIFGIGSTSNINMISLPRDIWIYDLRAKLNSIYYWGNQKKEGGGKDLAKSVVEEVVGQPVQYAVVLDFSGFKKIVDVLGGINVDVRNSFTDKLYPIAGKENDNCQGDPKFACRYQTVSFEKGLQYMDGETALKFVRSRHAEGDEGTDLARSARQERVIQAIKNKVLTKEIFMHPKKLFELKDAVLASVETDISPEAAVILARWFLEGHDKINSQVLSSDLLENPPINPKYDNLYVFIPKKVDENDPSGRSWTDVQSWIKCRIENNCS